MLLYVADAAESVRFYSDLLDVQIAEQHHQGFAMLPLRDGVMLGLWARDTVEAAPGAAEIAMAAESPAQLVVICEEWARREVKILQQPTEKDFGTTFVALDPDGHRLRVVASHRG